MFRCMQSDLAGTQPWFVEQKANPPLKQVTSGHEHVHHLE
jgi:hypothetical protein